MKLVSGGQTGVDTAALEIALERGLPHGGWVPKGRTNEDGLISERFQGLVEAPDSIPATRTRLNARDSDATLILSDGSESPGTAITEQFAQDLQKPCKVVVLDDTMSERVAEVGHWIDSVNPSVLNIAGPRESEAPGIRDKARNFLQLVLDR